MQKAFEPGMNWLKRILSENAPPPPVVGVGQLNLEFTILKVGRTNFPLRRECFNCLRVQTQKVYSDFSPILVVNKSCDKPTLLQFGFTQKQFSECSLWVLSDCDVNQSVGNQKISGLDRLSNLHQLIFSECQCRGQGNLWRNFSLSTIFSSCVDAEQNIYQIDHISLEIF